MEGDCEEHFFTLMSVLTRNSTDNSQTVQDMRGDLYRYQAEVAVNKKEVREKISSIVGLAEQF